jgi:hypothetical protein
MAANYTLLQISRPGRPVQPIDTVILARVLCGPKDLCIFVMHRSIEHDREGHELHSCRKAAETPHFTA